MVTNPRTTASDRSNLRLVRNDRKTKRNPSRSIIGRVISTLVALIVLAGVLRYLPPDSRNSQVQASRGAVEETPGELQLGSLQMSKALTGDALFLDGVVTNTGSGNVTGATVQVNFHDLQGNLVGSERKPIVGMTHGGTELVRNEFARHPIQPRRMRFFRVAIEHVPPTWNHETPDLKIVAVKAE